MGKKDKNMTIETKKLYSDDPGLEVTIEREVNEQPRVAWDSKLQYFFMVISYAVGLGNVWRFPYLCQRNGGGAFLIPYLIMLFIEGMPLLYLEFAVGQHFRRGSIGVWTKVHPYLAGIGVASAVTSFMVGIYYNAIIMWCFYYVANSFQYPLPWSDCERINGTIKDIECEKGGPTSYFWYRQALDISPGIDESDGIKWKMLLCLLFAWAVIYACIWKGIKSSGKVFWWLCIYRMDKSLNLLSLTSNVPASLQTPLGDPEFVKLPANHQCLICHKVMRDAVMTLCGHRMCEGCLTSLLFDPQNKEPVHCPGKEEFCIELKPDEIRGDNGTRREIRKLPVYCTYKAHGCSEKLPWKDLMTHESQCKYKPIPCPHTGCEAQCSEDKMEAHVKNCDYRPVRCIYCEETIPFCLQADHQNNTCRKAIISCPYKCDHGPRAREEIEIHMQTCQLRPQECKFKSMGCQFVGSERDMQKHNKDAADEHLQMITMYTASMDLQSMEMRRELQDISAERDTFQHIIESIQRDSRMLKDLVESIKVGRKELKLKIVEKTERIIHLEKKVDDSAKKGVVDKLGRDVQSVKDRQISLAERVNQIERSGFTGGGTGSQQNLQETTETASPNRDPATESVRELGYTDEMIKRAIDNIKQNNPGKEKIKAIEILEMIFTIDFTTDFTTDDDTSENTPSSAFGSSEASIQPSVRTKTSQAQTATSSVPASTSESSLPSLSVSSLEVANAAVSGGKQQSSASKEITENGLFYKTLLQFNTPLRTLLYLTIWILLINVVSSEQNVGVHWNVSTPAVFGQNTKLTCHLEEISKNPKECQVRQWSGGPRNIEGLIYNGRSSDRNKYDEYINHHSFQFSLVIKILAEADVNAYYTCSCNFKSFTKKLILDKDSFHYPPNGTYSNFTVINNFLQVRLHITKVYPKPNCSLVLAGRFIPDKAVNYSHNGHFYTVDYIAEYELRKKDCGKKPIIICTFGKVAGPVRFVGNETNKCLIYRNASKAGNSSYVTTPDYHNMTTTPEIVLPVLVVLIIVISVVLVVVVCCFIYKTGCQCRRKKDKNRDRAEITNDIRLLQDN